MFGGKASGFEWLVVTQSEATNNRSGNVVGRQLDCFLFLFPLGQKAITNANESADCFVTVIVQIITGSSPKFARCVFPIVDFVLDTRHFYVVSIWNAFWCFPVNIRIRTALFMPPQVSPHFPNRS